MFDINFLFEQICNSKRHEPFDCSLIDMTVVSEHGNGLLNTFVLKCQLCGITEQLATEDVKSEEQLNVNTALTLATVSTGVGFSQVEEITATLNMPMMSDKTYQKYHLLVAATIRQTAWDVMEESGREEAELARKSGDVDQNNVPFITVVTDGA